MQVKLEPSARELFLASVRAGRAYAEALHFVEKYPTPGARRTLAEAAERYVLACANADRTPGYGLTPYQEN